MGAPLGNIAVMGDGIGVAWEETNHQIYESKSHPHLPKTTLPMADNLEIEEC